MHRRLRRDSHHGVNGPACTTLRRQGRAVARAASPRHHRPRLRHAAHRRGEASAASRPRKARARAVIKGCLSAQRSADRSVRRLQQRHRRTAPASHWAARHGSGPPLARQRARTAATPCLIAPRGAPKAGTGAATLCPCHGCFSPPHPRTGALPIAALLEVSSCAAPATGPLRSFLPPCTRSYCNARGLLRQGPASWRAPAGRPPRAGRQRRPEGRPGKPRCWRSTVAGPACDGGQATRTRVGRAAGVGWRPAWWQRAPTPLVGRYAPWLDEWSFTGRAVCRAGTGERARAPSPARPP
jgi:hypothetical protein